MDKDKLKTHLSSMPIWDEAEDFHADLEVLGWRANQAQESTSELEKKLCQIDDNTPPVIIPEPKSSLEVLKTSPQVGEEVFAMDNPGKPWLPHEIIRVYRQAKGSEVKTVFKLSRKGSSNQVIEASKFAVACNRDHGDRLHVSKRVIAGLDRDHLFPGIIGQECCQENRNRYLVFMDNGTASYYKPEQVYPIIYQSKKPWADFKQNGMFNEELITELEHFFKQYPRRNVIQVRCGQEIDVKRGKNWVKAMVIGKECDILRVVYKDRNEEYLYRGSMRFIKRVAAAGRLTQNCYAEMNPLLVRNIHDYYQAGKISIQEDDYVSMILGHGMDRMNICGNTARKSTATRLAPPRIKVSSHPNQSTRPIIVIGEMASDDHKCSPDCIKAEADIDIIRDFYEISDLKVPLQLGWERILMEKRGTFSMKRGRTISKRIFYAYKTPCGKIWHQPHMIRRYLNDTNSKMDIDYFTTDRDVDLSRTLEDRLAYYYDANMAIDKETRQPLENKYISLINVVNQENLALDFIYNNERFPHKLLKAKGFSFNEDFKSGCDCEDDCSLRVNCACHRLNEELAGGINRFRGRLNDKFQYKEKRLYEQVSTGIFECNSFCKCSSKCPNRVVQNGIRVRLQVRKTVNKGWGVFVLDDVPRGAFICTYAAEILDDADQYGDSDMYFADLDYMTVLEQQKMILSDNEEEDEGIGVVGRKRRHVFGSDSDSDPDLDIVNNDYFPRVNNSGFIKIHTLLEESQDYTLDARLQGNVGRFFNHSCDPNSFVQNVFIESHDPRFPHVAFFTKKSLQADDEITWNYNYKIDSIEGRQIECNCGASNCKGRIL